MNKLTKLAVVALAAGLMSQVAHAQVPPGDLLLGFSSANTPSGNDYTLDLGAVGTDGSGLSGSSFNVSTFNTVFAGNVNPITMAAVGGHGVGVGEQLYLTGLHGGAVPNTITGTSISSAISDANGTALGVVASSGSQSWTSEAPLFAAAANNDPRFAISGSTLVLDLYSGTATSTGGTRPTTTIASWTDLGTLTLDLNAGTVTFAAAPVPEPSTYGLLAGAGLLLVSIRRQFASKQA